MMPSLLSRSVLVVSLAAFAGPQAFAVEPGWKIAGEKGCYNCHGDPPRKAVPSFKELISRYSRLGGKADAEFLRHEVSEIRELDVLAHRELGDEEGQAVIQWLVESAGRSAGGKMQSN